MFVRDVNIFLPKMYSVTVNKSGPLLESVSVGCVGRDFRENER